MSVFAIYKNIDKSIIGVWIEKVGDDDCRREAPNAQTQKSEPLKRTVQLLFVFATIVCLCLFVVCQPLHVRTRGVVLGRLERIRGL